MGAFRQDLISIAITFTIVLLVGGYLYVSSFAPLVAEQGLTGPVSAAAWEFTGEEIGACGTRCAGVRIQGDGSYRYRFVPATSSQPVFREGVLPLSLQRSIRQETQGFIDTLFLRTSRAEVCDAPWLASNREARYTLRYEGATYEFDSCAVQTELGITDESALLALWRYLDERWR